MSTKKQGNVTHQIVESLGLAIVVDGYGADGDFPTEAVLTEKLGVSRSVLREALKMLTAKGLLHARQRAGTIVKPENSWNLLDPDIVRWLLRREMSFDLLREFTQVRLAIEPTAAALAAQFRSSDRLQPIRAAVADMYDAAMSGEDPLNADVAFHLGVLHASGNRFFIELENMIEAALRASIRITHDLKSAGNIEDHEKVLKAIERSNVVEARQAMQAIIEEVAMLIQNADPNATTNATKGVAAERASDSVQTGALKRPHDFETISASRIKRR